MKKILALLLVILAVGFANATEVRASGETNSDTSEAAIASNGQFIAAATYEMAGDSAEKCCWDCLCTNSAHCHHCGVTAFTASLPSMFRGPNLDRSFNGRSDRLPPLDLNYSIIDPPRA